MTEPMTPPESDTPRTLMPDTKPETPPRYTQMGSGMIETYKRGTRVPSGDYVASKDYDKLQSALTAALAAKEAAERDLAALRADAERYRWLRDKGAANELYGPTASFSPGRGPYIRLEPPAMNRGSAMHLIGEFADAQVDAAMAAESGAQEG